MVNYKEYPETTEIDLLIKDFSSGKISLIELVNSLLEINLNKEKQCEIESFTRHFKINKVDEEIIDLFFEKIVNQPKLIRHLNNLLQTKYLKRDKELIKYL